MKIVMSFERTSSGMHCTYEVLLCGKTVFSFVLIKLCAKSFVLSRNLRTEWNWNEMSSKQTRLITRIGCQSPVQFMFRCVQWHCSSWFYENSPVRMWVNAIEYREWRMDSWVFWDNFFFNVNKKTSNWSSHANKSRSNSNAANVTMLVCAQWRQWEFIASVCIFVLQSLWHRKAKLFVRLIQLIECLSADVQTFPINIFCFFLSTRSSEEKYSHILWIFSLDVDLVCTAYRLRISPNTM